MQRKAKYYLNDQKQFVIENYNLAAPFASFLPSISGVHGKPLWAFYVNRGQCMSTIGIKNKKYQIMEFHPASAAYRQTPLQGFRTFLKVRDVKNGTITYYEPFQDFHFNKGQDIRQSMYITSYDLKLQDINKSIGIKTEVMYCTLPGESISSLVRSLSITNISGKALEIEVLDGLPVVIPYNQKEFSYKDSSNSSGAYMHVYNYATIPFYRLELAFGGEVEGLSADGGYFYLNFGFDTKGTFSLNKTIIDPEVIFGNTTNMIYPEGFCDENFKLPEKQIDLGRIPCGFGYEKINLNHEEIHTAYTLVGYAMNFEQINGFVHNQLNSNYMLNKIDENKFLIESLKSHIFTCSSSPEFDEYLGQSFIDNILRGGYPVQVGNGKHCFYVYSRKHNDLERDYGVFEIDTTYYSQGNSDFRDVNQNRRNDPLFYPYVGDTNIKIFFNLVQLDGFNPLKVKGSRFWIENRKAIEDVVDKYLDEKNGSMVMNFIKNSFTPGSLLAFIEQMGIRTLTGTAEELLNDLLSFCSKEDLASAEYGQGYWTDHWTYHYDLVEQYLAVYPEKAEELLFDSKEYTYYDNAMVVLPRPMKYVIVDGVVRQLDPKEKNEEKERLIKSRTSYPNTVRTDYGKGDIYRSSLIAKIICLLVNKMASLDAYGTGIEMEAGNPGWCDSLTGLPTYFGSSINESAEVKRLAAALLDIFKTYPIDDFREISLPEELYSFMDKIGALLTADITDFEYWDLSCQAKEGYRNTTLFGVSGKEKNIHVKELKQFLNAVVNKIDCGLEKAFDPETGSYNTYFIHEAVEFEILKTDEGEPLRNKNGYPCVKVLKFKQKPVTQFLEGNMRVLKVLKDNDRARSLYNAVKSNTGLYDHKLGMYKINSGHSKEAEKLGRHFMYPRGTRENESIFLHVEYKYLLELLKAGLYREFFEDMKTAFIPFIDPKRYGRSILENSSFLNSSAYIDEKTHGRGYCARLTGSSAEVLSIWLIMTSGRKPFYMDEKGELCLTFKPVLPGWLFLRESRPCSLYIGAKRLETVLPSNSFAFKFLGKTLVIYHNENRKDTFGTQAASIDQITFECDNKLIKIEGGIIPAPFSEKVRSGLIERIDIYMR